MENALLLPDITDKFYAEAANLTGQEQPEIKKISHTHIIVLSNLVSTTWPTAVPSESTAHFCTGQEVT